MVSSRLPLLFTKLTGLVTLQKLHTTHRHARAMYVHFCMNIRNARAMYIHLMKCNILVYSSVCTKFKGKLLGKITIIAHFFVESDDPSISAPPH